jgi:hypothetical protein
MQKNFEEQDERNKMINDLLERLTRARKNRTNWEDDHQPLLFGHPEYERLWEIEVGAQDLYVIYGGVGILGSSWVEYCVKRDKAKREDN